MVIESRRTRLAPIDWGSVSGVLVVVLAYFGTLGVDRSIAPFSGVREAYAGMEGLMGEEAEIVEWADREGPRPCPRRTVASSF
jgi:hypothetical protein